MASSVYSISSSLSSSSSSSSSQPILSIMLCLALRTTCKASTTACTSTKCTTCIKETKHDYKIILTKCSLNCYSCFTTRELSRRIVHEPVMKYICIKHNKSVKVTGK